MIIEGVNVGVWYRVCFFLVVILVIISKVFFLLRYIVLEFSWGNDFDF